MSDESICPCETFEHPVAPVNQPGLSHVAYRTGDFLSFRRALLQPLAGETELTSWRPNAQGDLLLQILEWWAYVADVLTFYNEQSLNENLLATATLDGNVHRLVALLGYRPRPGIGGKATLGVLLNGTRPVVVPSGFRVQSKPAGDQQPQTFETTQEYTLTPPDEVAVEPPGVLAGQSGQLYLQGAIKSIRPSDLLLLAPIGTQQGAVLVAVQNVNIGEDAAGKPYTEIIPAGAPSLPAADAKAYWLLRSTRSAGLWKYRTTINLILSPLELEGVDRAVRSGQAMVLRAPGSSLPPAVLHVTATSEQIWFTNGDGSYPPTDPDTIPAGAPHTRASWTSASLVDFGAWNNQKNLVEVLLGWEPAGNLRNAPVETYNSTPPVLDSTGAQQFWVGESQSMLIEDAEGNGAAATVSVLAAEPATLVVSSMRAAPPTLRAPLTVLPNVIELSRGKTVDAEVLGTGDATVAGQEFTLQKSPLTYLPAGDSYASTLRLYVNGVQWTEAKSFYRASAQATIFVTHEDDEGKTHVAFGDSVHGARLPTGAVITAYYRIESGADEVAPGGLTIIAKPVAGVRAVRQPVAAGGGADPDPRDQIRRYAPRSVLTFGRAISADDYESIAVRAPGVTRVRSVFAWDAAEQRATVTLYVGDTASAVDTARNALLVSADPNRTVSVVAAARVSVALLLALRVKPGHIVEQVTQDVRSILADPDTGVLGTRRTAIGESIYFSQISQACLGVEGVQAVTSAMVVLPRPDPATGSLWGLPPRINAAQHEFFSLEPASTFIFPEVASGA